MKMPGMTAEASLDRARGYRVLALAETEPEVLKEVYRIDDVNQDPQLLLEAAGRRRGCLLPGGAIDYDRAETAVLHDFRSGKLGRITLDPVPEEEA